MYIDIIPCLFTLIPHSEVLVHRVAHAQHRRLHAGRVAQCIEGGAIQCGKDTLCCGGAVKLNQCLKTCVFFKEAYFVDGAIGVEGTAEVLDVE